MAYDPVPADQLAIVDWALSRTEELLTDKGAGSASPWTQRWLRMLETDGFHPSLPKYGFGDPTSVGHIEGVCGEVVECGAVRHGAECFNYFFPQELDDEFLVVWDGLLESVGLPWKQFSEPALREFLLDRIGDGYAFPLNPCWPIRDPGWYDVFDALRKSDQGGPGKKTFESWYTPEVVARIDKIY